MCHSMAVSFSWKYRSHGPGSGDGRPARLLRGLAQRLFLELSSHVEPDIFQLVQQRSQTFEETLSLRSHEDSKGSYDIQPESLGQPAGTQVVEDDLQPELPGQDNGLCLACID